MHYFSSNNSKIPTKDILWLELINKVLTTPDYLIFQKISKSQQKNYISGIFWTFKSKLQKKINHAVLQITMFDLISLQPACNITEI